MSNYTKWKNSSFLREGLYPETMLSRHKHARRVKHYARLKRQFLVASPLSLQAPLVSSNTLSVMRDSRILLQAISLAYLPYLPLDKEVRVPEKGLPIREPLKANKRRDSVESQSLPRGLLEMGEAALTNGLLESGYRYFRVVL